MLAAEMGCLGRQSCKFPQVAVKYQTPSFSRKARAAPLDIAARYGSRGSQESEWSPAGAGLNGLWLLAPALPRLSAWRFWKLVGQASTCGGFQRDLQS